MIIHIHPHREMAASIMLRIIFFILFTIFFHVHYSVIIPRVKEETKSIG